MNLFHAISNLLRFDRTNWKALALCFFAAAVFWIFNSLNKNYSTNLKFPLLFEFDETKYIPTEPLPATLTLNVKGNGWELLRKSVGLKVPTIALPLERPLETRRIVASTLAPIISGQIGTLQVNYIVSDTLRLNIESKISRRLKLVPDIRDITFKRSFGRVSQVVMLPDSVLLEGPKSFVENFNDTLPVKVLATRIGESFRESVEIIVPHGDVIKRNPPVTEVLFDVAPIQEVEHWVKLKLPRMPWAVEIDSDSIKCVFVFPVKDQDRFVTDISECLANINIPEIKKGETKTVLPNLTGLPSYVELVHIDSVKFKKY